MEWTKEVVSEMIELYKERPCLWKIKDKTYLNKNLKRLAYDDILKILKSKNLETVTVKDIKTKIQNLRNEKSRKQICARI